MQHCSLVTLLPLPLGHGQVVAVGSTVVENDVHLVVNVEDAVQGLVCDAVNSHCFLDLNCSNARRMVEALALEKKR